MKSAQVLRMRAARHYEGVLARLGEAWDQGRVRSSKRDLDEAWPQIEALFHWLQGHGSADSEARAVLGRYRHAGRRVLRAYLPARERKRWFERGGEEPNSLVFRTESLCELAICWTELGNSDLGLNLAEQAQGLGRGLTDRRLESDVLWSLGKAQLHKGQYRAAVNSFARCLRLRRALLGPVHPDVLEAICGLSFAWDDLGEFERIIHALEPVVERIEADPVPEHTQLPTCYRMLGVALCQRGELQRAEACCERALSLDRALRGPDHPCVASDLNDLAVVRLQRGDLRGARDCLLEALAIERDSAGEWHPNVGMRWANLGAVWRRLGDPQRAIDALERALAIQRAAHGTLHPYVANSLSHLARCHLDLGRAQSGIHLLEEALELRRKLDAEPDAWFESDRRALEAARASLAQGGSG